MFFSSHNFDLSDFVSFIKKLEGSFKFCSLRIEKKQIFFPCPHSNFQLYAYNPKVVVVNPAANCYCCCGHQDQVQPLRLSRRTTKWVGLGSGSAPPPPGQIYIIIPVTEGDRFASVLVTKMLMPVWFMLSGWTRWTFRRSSREGGILSFSASNAYWTREGGCKKRIVRWCDLEAKKSDFINYRQTAWWLVGGKQIELCKINWNFNCGKVFLNGVPFNAQLLVGWILIDVLIVWLSMGHWFSTILKSILNKEFKQLS